MQVHSGRGMCANALVGTGQAYILLVTLRDGFGGHPNDGAPKGPPL